MYIMWPEIQDVEYLSMVKIMSLDVVVQVFNVECFPCLSKDGEDAFVVKYLVEFPNKERKWVAMSDIEVLDERQDKSE